MQWRRRLSPLWAIRQIDEGFDERGEMSETEEARPNRHAAHRLCGMPERSRQSFGRRGQCAGAPDRPVIADPHWIFAGVSAQHSGQCAGTESHPAARQTRPSPAKGIATPGQHPVERGVGDRRGGVYHLYGHPQFVCQHPGAFHAIAAAAGAMESGAGTVSGADSGDRRMD